VKSGVIKGAPPPDSREESELVAHAKFYAAQYFGTNVINSGLDDKEANRDYYMRQMQREAESGQYDQWDPRESFSPQQLTDFLSRATNGKASLASQVKGPPTSIQDFQQRGAPSFVKPGAGAAPQGGEQPQAQPPEQEGV
jgi:hypothetical protein